MPHADFSEQNDPWDSFARELGAENEPLDEIAEAPTEEPAEDVGQEPVEVAAEEPAEEVAEEVAEEAGAEPEEGSVSWNFLAEELGIKDAGTEPVAAATPADEIFSDYTPTYIEPDSEDGPPANDDTEEEDAVDEFGQGLDGEDEQEPARRPRRRGRRRSGRGRSTRETPTDDSGGDSAEPTGAADDGTEENDAEGEEKPSRRRRSRRRGKRGGKERADGNDAEASEVPSEDSAESPEGDSDGAAKEGSKHRKIPTWGEAISVVVDANMTTRSKQPASKPAKGRRRKSKSKPKR